MLFVDVDWPCCVSVFSTYAVPA